MSWLKALIDEKLLREAKATMTDRTFGFEDIRRVADLVEGAVKANAKATMEAHRASLQAAGRDPFAEGKNYSTFRSMAADFWQTEMMFPRVARNALLIAIYSHTEYLLLSWCMSAAIDPVAAKSTLKKREPNESPLQRYLRCLRDDVRIGIGDYTKWPEWEAIDAYRRARNCLAHNGGIVDRQDDAQKIAALPHIQVDTSRLLESEPVVHLLPGACEAASSTAQAFIGRIVAVGESQLDKSGEGQAEE